MKIIADVVRQVGEYAKDFTEGTFYFQAKGLDFGNGVRYFDGPTMQVWIGRNASTKAAAYYIGGMLGWAQHSGKEIPDEVRVFCQEVQSSYASRTAAEEWEQAGREKARLTLASRQD